MAGLAEDAAKAFCGAAVEKRRKIAFRADWNFRGFSLGDGFRGCFWGLEQVIGRLSGSAQQGV